MSTSGNPRCNRQPSNNGIPLTGDRPESETDRSFVVCLFGDYDVTYPREAVIIKGLARHGIQILECNCALKHQGPKVRNKLLYVAKAYKRLLKAFWPWRWRITHMIVPHNNHLVVPLAYCLANVFGFQLIVDGFDPAYHTALLAGEKKLMAKTRFWLEKVALHLADKVLVETLEFKRLYVKTYSLRPGRVFPLPVGAIERKSSHVDGSRLLSQKGSDFLVLYWGNFHRHHGLNTIIGAATLLREYSDIKFILVGRGTEYNRIVELVRQKRLTNVCLPGRLLDSDLVRFIEKADVCLGIFSRHELALCSLTNKVLEAMAMGKPVITERSPATLGMLRDRVDALLVPPEDPAALASAILDLKRDPHFRLQLGQEAYMTFQKAFSEQAIGQALLGILIDAVVKEAKCGST